MHGDYRRAAPLGQERVACAVKPAGPTWPHDFAPRRCSMPDPGPSVDHKAVPPPRRRASRLAPDAFNLPVEEIRTGHYSDKYFVRTRDILASRGRSTVVTVQVFQRQHALVAGTDEAIAILKLCLSEGYRFEDLVVHSLCDGDRAEPHDSVMTITGPYVAFAHLETLYLGVLARSTRIATNTRAAVEAAWPKSVTFFPARHDVWGTQRSDGLAAHLAGAASVSTDAQGDWWGGRGAGTIPHALIASYGGDTVAAVRAMADHLDDAVPLVALVDFDNDCVGTSLAVARALRDRLWGVRLDTSVKLVDRSLAHETRGTDLTDGAGGTDDTEVSGVNPRLVVKVREALDRAGFSAVRIVVSGGFAANRIREFEARGVPVDSYGVGSSLMAGTFDYTADVVRVNHAHVAKAGRTHRPNARLKRVK